MSLSGIARRGISLMDLTELGDTVTAVHVAALCAKAIGGGAVPKVAAVCVWPRHAALAIGLLRGTGIRVATVINFPSGDAPLATVLAEARAAVSDAVDEIDLVMPYKAFLAGDATAAETMIRAVRSILPPGRKLKVIFETGAFPDRKAIRAASNSTIAAGADFIKTSTGKIAGGATLEAAETMMEAIRVSGRDIGFKPSGGIRTMNDATSYLALADRVMGPDWATPETFRFGASGLHGALAAVLTGNPASALTGSPAATKGY